MLIERQKRLSRVRFKHPIRVVTLEGQPRVIRTLTANVSRKGLFLRMPEPLPLGTKVALSLEAGGRALALAQAEVVWGRVQESHLPGRFPGCGVRFTEFMHPRAEELVDYLVHNLDRGKPLLLAPPERPWMRWVPRAAGAALLACAVLAVALLWPPSDPEVEEDPEPAPGIALVAEPPTVRAVEASAPAEQGRPPAGELGRSKDAPAVAPVADTAPSEGAPGPSVVAASPAATGDATPSKDAAGAPVATAPARSPAATPSKDAPGSTIAAAPTSLAATAGAAGAPGSAAVDAAPASGPIAADGAPAPANSPAVVADSVPAPPRPSAIAEAAAPVGVGDAARTKPESGPSAVAGPAPSPVAAGEASLRKTSPSPSAVAAPGKAAPGLPAAVADPSRPAPSKTEPKARSIAGGAEPAMKTAVPAARKSAASTKKGTVKLPSGAAPNLAWTLSGTELRLSPELAGQAQVTRAFVLTGPPRAVFDVSGSPPLRSHVVPAAPPYSTAVRLGKQPAGTRIVIDLDAAPKRSSQDGAALVLSF